MRASFKTMWSDAGYKRQAFWLVLLGVVMVAAFRASLAFDIDALTILGLSALLLWTQGSEARRNALIGRKLDYLVNLLRYGPLTAEDREVIAALQAQTDRLASRKPATGTSGPEAPRLS